MVGVRNSGRGTSNRMSKKNPKIPMKGGAEYDAFTDWKKYYCYLSRSGVAKSIKRGYNKRFRKDGKKQSTETE